MNKVLPVLAVAAFAAAAPWTAAFAVDHQVQMLNKGASGPMQFEPAFLKVAPGDTVTFVPADKGHNTESFTGMLPDGSEPWKGKINEQVTVTLTQEGLYAYKCQPHLAMGMVGLIQVGAGTAGVDAAEAGKLPGKAKMRMQELLAEAGAADAAPAQ